MAFINVFWRPLAFTPPITANATTYRLVNATAGTSILITGTGFTYDVNGIPTGGVITSVSLVIDATIATPETVLTTLTSIDISFADFGAKMASDLALRSQINWAGVISTDGTLVSFSPTLIRLLNLDNSFTDIIGTGLDITVPGSAQGNVSSIVHIAADGTTVLTSVSVNVTLQQAAAAVDNGEDLVQLLNSGDTTVTGVNNAVTIGADTYFTTIYDGPGNDTIAGGVGGWFVEYEFATAGVIVNLATGLASGGGGNDTLTNITAAGGSVFADTLTGNDQGNTLHGRQGNDTLLGGLGDDSLEGGAGDDSVDGGGGIDTADYTVNDDAVIGVTVSLLLQGVAQNTIGAGLDTLISIENLTGSEFNDTLIGNGIGNSLRGGDGVDLIEGRAGADVLEGGAGADSLDGGAGIDIMVGGAGDDIFIVDDIADLAIESLGEGRDTIYTGLAFYQMGDNVEDLSMTGAVGTFANGNGLDNLMVGNVGADALDGKAGADFMVGGGGNDSYFVDNISDVAIELVGGGQDTIYTSLAFYQMGLNVEEVSITAATGTFAVGNSVDNLMVGNAGADALDGGGGADFMVGNGGNDSYFVDNIADVAIELVGGGQDTIYTSLAFYQMGLNVEEVSITAATGTFAVGNDVNNLMVGNAGADALDGGLGADFMVGGAGNDSYFVDNISDVAVELVGEGRDTIYTALAFYQMGDNIEEISVNGGAGTTAVGNALANLMVGGANADSLNGGAGNDTLTGNGGDDRFVFRSGQGSDIINDFAAGAASGDHVQLLGFGASFDTFGEVIAAATQVGIAVVFDFGGGQTLTLQNVTLGTLNAGDFIFGP